MIRKISHNIVSHLLKRNISTAQLIGYALSSLVGLSIVLVAIKFYCDVRSISNNDTGIGKEFLIVQREVNGIGNIFSDEENGFSQSDIDEIVAQPWVKRIGTFTSADFNVSAYVDMNGQGLSTALFLESVPDEFIDINLSDWNYEPGISKAIPIIISKDYLALYNFGFAASRGLPQISETMMKLVPIKLSVSGNGKQEWFNARIAGFSSRLNTIAVPESFMDYANNTFGEKSPLPSRVIIETNSPGDPQIKDFLSSKHYELAGDKDASGKTSYFLKVITGVVSAIGIVISILSLGILLLSIWLLLYKNKSKTEQLILLGYSPSQICTQYYRLVFFVNIFVLGISIAVMFLISLIWKSSLVVLSITPGSPLAAILSGVFIISIITIISFMAVRNSVINCFYPKHS